MNFPLTRWKPGKFCWGTVLITNPARNGCLARSRKQQRHKKVSDKSLFARTVRKSLLVRSQTLGVGSWTCQNTNRNDCCSPKNKRSMDISNWESCCVLTTNACHTRSRNPKVFMQMRLFLHTQSSTWPDQCVVLQLQWRTVQAIQNTTHLFRH